MSKVVVLSEQSIRQVLNMEDVIRGIEKVYLEKNAGTGVVWDMVFYEFEPGVADMDIKSGYLKEEETYGLKLVSWYGENSEKGKPALYGTTLLFDAKTGEPTALLNAEYITGMRTGAAGAIGAKYLAKKGAKTLLMVGAGHQAEFQVLATLTAVKSINRVFVYDPIDKGNAVKAVEKFSRKIGEKFREKENREIEFMVVESLEGTVGESEIIITATPSRKPMIMKEWVKPGTHFSCVGSDMPGKQEIDERIFQGARVFVDDIPQASRVGEVEIPIKKGQIEEKDLTEIGRVLSGEVKGRLTEMDITIFDSTGIALQDIMTSKLALSKAKELGLGVIIDL